MEVGFLGSLDKMSKLKPRDVHYDLGANEFGNNAVRFIQALVAEFVGKW